MKYLILVCCLCLVSCENYNRENGIVYKEFKLKGHSYLKIMEGPRWVILHNPDCQCRKKND